MATYYWVGGSGTWDNASSANWSATSGGAGGAGVPNAADSVIFDAGSGTGTCTTAATAAGLNLTLNTANVPILLGANLSLAGQFNFTAGAVDLAGFTFACTRLDSNNSNTRSIAFGSGKIQCFGNNSSVWAFSNLTGFTFTGTPAVELTYAGAVGTRSFRHGDAGGASEAKAVSFLITGGTDAMFFNNNSVMLDLNFGAYAGTFANVRGTIYGSLTLSSLMTLTGGTNAFTFGATSGTKTITMNGKAPDFPFTIDGAGGSFQFADPFALGATNGTLGLTRGTLNANNQPVTVNVFSSSNSNTRSLTLGSGTWTITGSGNAWNCATSTNITVNASTGTISMTSASAKTFAGGGRIYPTLNQGGAGALTITGANTFANITNTVQPATITFPANTTTTVGDFSVSGTSGNQITLNSSTAGTRATLSDASGQNSVSFCTIKDINATGGATWSSFTSNGNVDGGNNVGWDFFAQAFRYIYTRRKNKVIFQS